MPSSREEALEGRPALAAAGDAVDRRGMRMDDVGLGEEAVHEGLDRGALGLAGHPRGHEIGQGGRLAGLRSPRGRRPSTWRRAWPCRWTQKPAFGYRAERSARGLHVEGPRFLERSVAAAGQDPFGVGSVAAG